MTLSEIIQDIHACAEDMLMYERKYNILSETFYAAYSVGEEPPDHVSVLEWNDWAGAYQIWLRRRRQYQAAIQALEEQNSLMQIIEKAILTSPNLPRPIRITSMFLLTSSTTGFLPLA